ncbi:MAG: amidohydrolase family protein [Gammaproteobacteria bacterium]|jgi:hypothetical protein
MKGNSRIIRIITASLIFLIGSSSLVAQDNSNTLVLTGATIIDGISDAPIRGYSLLIEGNTIEQVIPPGAAIPGNAVRIDLTGKFIIPGLIDNHVHWLDWMGEMYVNHGVTSVVGLTELSANRRMESQSSHTVPRLFHSANRPPFNKDHNRSEIRQIVKEWLEKEPDIAHFPTNNRDISEAYSIAAREVHRAGYMVFGHAENVPLSLEDGHDVIEHIWGFAQAVMTDQELEEFQNGEHLTWATFMTGRWEQLDTIIKEAVEKGAYLNPTLTYEWGAMSKDAARRELDDYKVISDPDLSYFPTSVAKSLLAKHRQIKNFSNRYGNLPYVSKLPVKDLAQFKQGYKNINELVRRFVAAGGKIQAGTDAITAGVPGLGLHQEMQMLVEAGLTPMQAIKSATRWSAEQFEGLKGARGPAKVGSIESGKFADLVVLDANPLQDIYNSQKISRVMKDGRWLTPGYHPEYYSFTSPPRSIAGSTFAPVISSITPAIITAGSSASRVALEGSGFQMISLIRVNGRSVKTHFINPRRLEFDIPLSLLKSAIDPYRSPGPFQEPGIVGFRSVEVHVYSPPPVGGTSDSVHLMVRPQ